MGGKSGVTFEYLSEVADKIDLEDLTWLVLEVMDRRESNHIEYISKNKKRKLMMTIMGDKI